MLVVFSMTHSDDHGEAAAGSSRLMPKKAFLAFRDEWIDYVNQCERLTHATTRVGTFIALRMNADDQCSYWPVAKIAKMIPRKPGKRMSTRTVSVAIEHLQREGLLIVWRRSRRENYVYSLRLPHFESH